MKLVGLILQQVAWFRARRIRREAYQTR